MRVRVELVAQGTEPRPVLWIYEAFPGGGVSGDWNSTQDHRRYLFPVRLENGRYRVTRDFRRSIYPVYSGRHERLPLDETRPLWERFALLQWWLRSDYAPAFGYTNYADPGQVFGVWRTAKVLRGLLRHPDKHVRLIACEDLLHLSRAQDECWAALTQEDQNSLSRIWNMVPAHDSWQQSRSFETRAHRRWEEIAGRSPLTTGDVDELRLFTTINNVALRQQFCRKFQERFPGDAENGCPADSPPPATIVTENGDVPLAGAWPEQ